MNIIKKVNGFGKLVWALVSIGIGIDASIPANAASPYFNAMQNAQYAVVSGSGGWTNAIWNSDIITNITAIPIAGATTVALEWKFKATGATTTNAVIQIYSSLSKATSVTNMQLWTPWVEACAGAVQQTRITNLTVGARQWLYIYSINMGFSDSPLTNYSIKYSLN